MARGQDQLAFDRLTVERVRVENRATLLEIGAFRAHPDKVMRWYRANDPLHEQLQLEAVRSLNTGDIADLKGAAEELAILARAFQNSAALLVAHALRPDLTSKRNWRRKLEMEMARRDPDIILNPDASLSVDDIIGYCIKTAQQHGLSQEQLGHLAVAGDMLLAASCSFMPELLEHFDDFDLHRGLEPLMSERRRIDQILADFLNERVAKTTLAAEQEDFKLRLLGLRALWRRSVSVFLNSGVNRKKYQSERIDMLAAMTEALRSTFLECPESPLLKPELSSSARGKVRGQLCELLWFLDAQLELERRWAHGIYVMPAQSFQDQPHIGHPQLRRAFDFVINTDFDRMNQMPIQIKTAPGGGQYHPTVRVYREEGFRYEDPALLREKLDVYDRLIRGGLRRERVGEAEKYILPTAKQALDDVGAPTLSRAVRRRLARSQRRRR